MHLAELIGSLAAVLTTSAFIPQAASVLRTRNTSGISLGMYMLFATGIALWLVYGLMIASLPVILSNTVTLPLALVILAITWSNHRDGGGRDGGGRGGGGRGGGGRGGGLPP